MINEIVLNFLNTKFDSKPIMERMITKDTYSFSIEIDVPTGCYILDSQNNKWKIKLFVVEVMCVKVEKVEFKLESGSLGSKQVVFGEIKGKLVNGVLSIIEEKGKKIQGILSYKFKNNKNEFRDKLKFRKRKEDSG